MNRFSLSAKDTDSTGASHALLKFLLVAGGHAAILTLLLQASAVIKHGSVPMLASLMTVTVDLPARNVAAENLPRTAAPAPRPPANAAAGVVTYTAAAASPAAPPATSEPLVQASTAPAASATAAPAIPTPAPFSQASFDAAYLNNPEPAYPLASRRQGESGKVLLLVLVTPQGAPERVEIQHSSGFPRLDEAALAAVRKWRFVPARRGEQLVAASVVVPLTFRLDS